MFPIWNIYLLFAGLQSLFSYFSQFIIYLIHIAWPSHLLMFDLISLNEAYMIKGIYQVHIKILITPQTPSSSQLSLMYRIHRQYSVYVRFEVPV
jgi:hypothetical protein